MVPDSVGLPTFSITLSELYLGLLLNEVDIGLVALGCLYWLGVCVEPVLWVVFFTVTTLCSTVLLVFLLPIATNVLGLIFCLGAGWFGKMTLS